MARKGYNIDEMRALKLAYDGDVTRNDKLRFWLMPGILTGALTTLVMTPRISFKWLTTVKEYGSPVYIPTDFDPHKLKSVEASAKAFKKTVEGVTYKGMVPAGDVKKYNAVGKSLYKVVGDNAYLKGSGISMDAFFSSIWDAKFQILFILLWVLIGFLFGRFKLYPLIIERGYRSRQYDEKNRFVNALTQLLTAESMSVYKCLTIAQHRASGQFGMDLDRFIFRLRDASEDDVVGVFNDFCERYRDDLIFIQYMDQIRVTYTEGRQNLKTIQQLKDWHGQVKIKQSNFLQRKNRVVNQFKLYLGLSSGLIVMVHFMPMTLNEYFHNFSMSWSGVGTTLVYMLALLAIVNKLTNVYFDDNVLSTVK